MAKRFTQKPLRTLTSACTRRISLVLLMCCGLFSPAAFAQTFPDFEVEPNNSSAEATPIPSNPAKMRGYIYLMGDIDFYSFTANAGDRVYAATMTSLSSNGSVDSQLDLIAPDGTTVLENDNDNGVFGTTSSSIAGVTIPANGTYYIQVRHNSPATQMRPYDLYVQVQSGSPVAEIESNDATGTAQVLPAGGWISGSTSSTTDADFYSINLNAGESVFISLDLDPERDLTEWNGQVGLGLFSGLNLGQNDAGTAGPDSEAAFFTVKESGTYYVSVSIPAGGITFGTYHLSVSKFAAETGYTAYPSASVPVTIPDGPGVVTSTLTIPDSKRIKDMSVSISLTHNFMADLDVTLTSPQGNVMHLFSDIGSVTVGANTNMDLIFNDFNAIPPIFIVLNGLGHTPELAALLNDYFKGIDAQGTWTLTIYDDATGDGGTLHNWAIHILEDTDPDLTGFSAIFDEDFETDDGGFTHSGVQDEWERGTPIFAPITTANSGTQCWKTDLDNVYEPSANQVLESPDIDLTAATGDIIINWAMKFQVERPDFDRLEVTLEEVGGGGLTQSLFIWYGADMVANIGNPITTIQLSTGWRIFYVDVSAFAGKIVRFKVRLITDTSVQRCGVAIDDVKVYNKPLGSTIVASAGTGGTISPSGNVIVPNGANQMFTITPDACYSIADVLVDGSSVGAVTSYTFFNVTTGHTISASFTAIPIITYYLDDDGDGFGDPAVSQMTCTGPPTDYVLDNTDCDDTNGDVNPGETEVCNTIDDDCDTMIDEGVQTTFYADADGDGFGNPAASLLACTAPMGYVLDHTDCNDANMDVNPGETEVCNTIDDDCDTMIDEGVQTTFYRDLDGDGFGNPSVTQLGCTVPMGYVADNTDCNDGNGDVNPGETEVCNTIDDDCDAMIDEGVQTTFYRDMDGDGFGNPAVTQLACSAPMGYVANDDDCDDTNGAVKPGATEVCDGIDNNCDGTIDNILSGDGNWNNSDVGTANGNANYPPCDAQPNDVFTIQASGFSTSSSDKLHLVSQELCGNVELIARVTNVSGGGWAGITMRETLDPGSKKVALKTQLTNNIRREIRTTTNGGASILNLIRPTHTWLRLVRTGGNFVGYTSPNGSTWTFAFSATVSMTGCIQVGLFAESINANVVTTATFDNVQVIGGVLPLIQAPQTPKTASVFSPEVYPNPTTGEVNIDLEGYADPIGTVKVFDAYGKMIMQQQLDGSPLFRMKLDGADGLYFLSIEVEGEAPTTKRVVVVH
jgi:subtilisin-like proprotein convertase family protein